VRCEMPFSTPTKFNLHDAHLFVKDLVKEPAHGKPAVLVEQILSMRPPVASIKGIQPRSISCLVAHIQLPDQRSSPRRVSGLPMPPARPGSRSKAPTNQALLVKQRAVSTAHADAAPCVKID